MNKQTIVSAKCIRKGINVEITETTTYAPGANGDILCTWIDYECSNRIGCANQCRANTHMADNERFPKYWSK